MYATRTVPELAGLFPATPASRLCLDDRDSDERRRELWRSTIRILRRSGYSEEEINALLHCPPPLPAGKNKVPENRQPGT